MAKAQLARKNIQAEKKFNVFVLNVMAKNGFGEKEVKRFVEVSRGVFRIPHHKPVLLAKTGEVKVYTEKDDINYKEEV